MKPHVLDPGEAFANRSDDPTDVPHQHKYTYGVPEALPPGNVLLLAELIRGAMKDALDDVKSPYRAPARAWLCGADALISMQICCDGLGLDFKRTSDAIVRRWDVAVVDGFIHRGRSHRGTRLGAR